MEGGEKKIMQPRLMRVGTVLFPQKWLRWGQMMPGRVFLESSAVCYSFILVRFLPFFGVFTSLLHLVLKIEACEQTLLLLQTLKCPFAALRLKFSV